MKTLYLIRHAKSSWSFDLDDHDRPLGVRGRRDVRRIASYLSNNEPTPDLMITSTASRAFYTALFIADEWNYPEDAIELSQDLYLGSAEITKDILKHRKENSIALFGHNPGLTSLINQLQNDYLDNLPTCGIYTISFNCQHWHEISKTNGKLHFYVSPKKLNGH